MGNAMVIGYDSYRDSSARGKSVGAAVFSLDRDMTRWFSQCDLHKNDGEESEHLAKFIKRAHIFVLIIHFTPS